MLYDQLTEDCLFFFLVTLKHFHVCTKPVLCRFGTRLKSDLFCISNSSSSAVPLSQMTFFSELTFDSLYFKQEKVKVTLPSLAVC